MTDYEQKGYDAFIEWLAGDDNGDSTCWPMEHFHKTVTRLDIKTGTDKRRDFVAGWQKARSEV